jgi:hypothetical protein
MEKEPRLRNPEPALETILHPESPGTEYPTSIVYYLPCKTLVAIVRAFDGNFPGMFMDSEPERLRAARHAEAPPHLGGVLSVDDHGVV